jgi:hypothetical protein
MWARAIAAFTSCEINQTIDQFAGYSEWLVSGLT